MVGAVANQPEPIFSPASKRASFKIADPQYITTIDPASTVEEMTNTLWQSIGGHEILSIVKRDLIDGKNRDYGLVSDLFKLFEEYESKTIMSLEDSSPFYFNEFGIKFERYIPTTLDTPVTYDSDLDQITIFVSNLNTGYDVEVQSVTSEELFRDTIYGGTES